MKKLLSFYNKIPKILKNKFSITFLLFLIWIFFFDNYNLINRYNVKKSVKDAQSKKEYYQTEVKEINRQMEELLTDPASLEKFARERYLMKRDDEDIFVIIVEEE